MLWAVPRRPIPEGWQPIGSLSSYCLKQSSSKDSAYASGEYWVKDMFLVYCHELYRHGMEAGQVATWTSNLPDVNRTFWAFNDVEDHLSINLPRKIRECKHDSYYVDLFFLSLAR